MDLTRIHVLPAGLLDKKHLPLSLVQQLGLPTAQTQIHP